MERPREKAPSHPGQNRGQAALLLLGWIPPHVRLGDQGVPGYKPVSAARESASGMGLSDLPVCASAANDLAKHMETSSRAPAGVVSGQRAADIPVLEHRRDIRGRTPGYRSKGAGI